MPLDDPHEMYDIPVQDHCVKPQYLLTTKLKRKRVSDSRVQTNRVKVY